MPYLAESLVKWRPDKQLEKNTIRMIGGVEFHRTQDDGVGLHPSSSLQKHHSSSYKTCANSNNTATLIFQIMRQREDIVYTAPEAEIRRRTIFPNDEEGEEIAAHPVQSCLK